MVFNYCCCKKIFWKACSAPDIMDSDSWYLCDFSLIYLSSYSYRAYKLLTSSKSPYYSASLVRMRWSSIDCFCQSAWRMLLTFCSSRERLPHAPIYIRIIRFGIQIYNRFYYEPTESSVREPPQGQTRLDARLRRLCEFHPSRKPLRTHFRRHHAKCVARKSGHGQQPWSGKLVQKLVQTKLLQSLIIKCLEKNVNSFLIRKNPI